LDEISEELTTVFGIKALESLFRNAFVRGERWIQTAVEQIFELGEPGVNETVVEDDSTQVSDSESTVVPSGPSEEPKSPSPAPREMKTEPLKDPGPTRPVEGYFESALRDAGFEMVDGAWARGEERYWKVPDSVFPWVRAAGDDNRTFAWVRWGSIESGNPLEIDADVWEEGRKQGAVLVEVAGTDINVIPFKAIEGRIESGKWSVIPAKVRISKSPGIVE